MKHSHILAGLALGLSLLGIAPVQAEPAQEEILISQVRGSEVQDPIDVYRADWLKFKFEDYAIGRIRGVTGDVAQIQILSAGIQKDAHIRMTYDVGFTTGERDVWHVTTRMPRHWPTLVAGSDVIMREVNGEWVIISPKRSYLDAYFVDAMPRWISRLDLREVPLVSRTDIDWDRPDMSLPPLSPNTAPIEEPVPGMW
ncbi:MAG: hypothetical protein QNJ64_02255 [Crocosphaera sp.]|nr:hypothetical protein [Crocosphaera sp.]